MNNLLDDLNEQQLAAVTAPHAHRLILAGAGSGKTRVLVHRMAWLMAEQGVSPFALLAVTFTNKAAHEMRGRIETLRGVPTTGMWVGTFHGLAHRLLRTHHEAAELPNGFQILDSDDQLRMIKRVMKSLEIDDDKFPPKQAQWFINKAKEEGKRPNTVATGDYYGEVMQRIYAAYETVCRRSGLVDFTELLLRSLELLQQHDDIRQHYQNRFLHILVDEFQDTNTIQYQWLALLCGESTAVMAVGDDDQSIYSWRGAKIENIQRFNNDYAGAQTIRLEQNYRSTQIILDAANTVIANNNDRLGKNLWTAGQKGELIELYDAFNEHDEAHYISCQIQQRTRLDSNYNEFAILYRSNAQSRILEESLLKANIPYRIYGGQKFFDRAEVKDALGYLRLIANRHDDAAFERVVNTPTRGIGNMTLNTLRTTARDMSTSLWTAAQHLLANNTFSARAHSCMQAFLDLINQLDEKTHGLELGEQTDYMLRTSGLLDHFRKDKSEKGLSRLENLDELISATSDFTPNKELSDLPPLSAFLADVALETGDNQAEEHSDSVSLMTLHAAKGLEFNYIFLSGMEEDLFPHRMSIGEPQGLAEERRLCYVGMTRAKQKLFLSHAQTRRLHGTDRYNKPSRFLAEIPAELVQSVRPKAKISRPRTDNWQHVSATTKRSHTTNFNGQTAGDSGLKIGQAVSHAKFGDGMILNYEGSGSHTRVQVKFNRHGIKWLVASFAKLTTL
jgi:DNA helicase II / ATP-dependent DNA helicase PcrA